MLAFLGLGPFEIAIVGVVAVLLFGSRLPSVARQAGKSFTEFKRGMQDLQDDVRRSIDAEEYAATPRRLESAPAKTGDEGAVATGYPEPRSPLDGPDGDGDTEKASAPTDATPTAPNA